MSDESRKWSELRSPLLVYVNQHPSARVHETGEDLAQAIGLALAKRRAVGGPEPTFLIPTPSKSFVPHRDEVREADGAVSAALAKADALLGAIRQA
jgi:hypothetical protein